MKISLPNPDFWLPCLFEFICFFMHVFYYGNEMLDKNTLEGRVHTGKWRKQVGGLCGPLLTVSLIYKKKKKK